jgi:hypothetical protein
MTVFSFFYCAFVQPSEKDFLLFERQNISRYAAKARKSTLYEVSAKHQISLQWLDICG